VTDTVADRPSRTNGASGGITAPPGTHEWISFPDAKEDRTWVFDATFLLSPWHCVFGAGCQGVLTGPAPELVQGCCSYGAHFTGKDDAARVHKAAAKLTAEDWQFHKRGRKNGKLRVFKTDAGGDKMTRIVEGACIFLNRPGFAGGPGCALHAAALRRGERPMDAKPDVCWQLPLRREDETDATGHVTSTVRQWDRRHWGAGGFEFHWWCTEAPEAFTAAEPVYRSLQDELVGLVGKRVYRTLAAELERRQAAPAAPVAHPALVPTPVSPPRRRS
jgi:hypothetical protein